MATVKEQVYQWSFSLMAGLTAMAAGAWTGWPSQTILTLERDGYLTSSQSGWMVAIMDLGHVIIAFPAAYLINRIGRKFTLLLTIVLYLTASAAVIFYRNVYLIYLARFMAGVGRGVSFVVLPVYISEIANTSIRGALSTTFPGSLQFGTFLSFLIGPYLSYFWFNVCIATIALIFTSTFFMFPESPYYLLMIGRVDAARLSLKKYRATLSGNEESERELEKEFEEMRLRVETDMSSQGRFVDLFATRGNRRALLTVFLLIMFQRGSGLGPIISFSPKIMPPTGGGFSVSTYLVLFSVFGSIVNCFTIPLVDRFGRKPLLLISSALTAVMTLLPAVYHMLKHFGHDVSSYDWLPYFCLVGYNVTFGIGLGLVPLTLIGELFPSNVKSYASCVATITLAATTGLTNKMLEVLYTAGYGVHFMYFLFTAMSLSCLVFSWYYVFETKGRTFTEIQCILKSKSFNRN